MCENVNYKLMSNELEANLEAKVAGFVVVCWVSSMPAHACVCVAMTEISFPTYTQT